MASVSTLVQMVEIAARRAREPVERLVDRPLQTAVNNEELARAANWALLAEEYRRQVEDYANSRVM
jgi:hypothetical protein